VVQAGQLGVVIQRERLRLEDGVEAGRTKEGEWTAAEPQDQITARGTRAVARSLDTPEGPIEYYRATTMYATSYSPCQQGYEKCSLSTSSGTPLKKGVVAVTLAWYRLLAGSRVYIPGYGVGVIADVGGGIPGTYWIDLGYSEEDYQQWSQTVTVYFLTPIPANVPLVLP
jgi:3D (Asp-Asp-Asp) domain-containing protein